MHFAHVINITSDYFATHYSNIYVNKLIIVLVTGIIPIKRTRKSTTA